MLSFAEVIVQCELFRAVRPETRCHLGMAVNVLNMLCMSCMQFYLPTFAASYGLLSVKSLFTALGGSGLLWLALSTFTSGLPFTMRKWQLVSITGIVLVNAPYMCVANNSLRTNAAALEHLVAINLHHIFKTSAWDVFSLGAWLEFFALSYSTQSETHELAVCTAATSFIAIVGYFITSLYCFTTELKLRKNFLRHTPRRSQFAIVFPDHYLWLDGEILILFIFTAMAFAGLALKQY